MGFFLHDQRFIPAHGQAAVLLDLAADQAIDSNVLLRHTGLFREQIVQGEAQLSSHDFLQLIHNSRRSLADSELSFRYGQRLFPGHYGAASTLLANAGNLAQALQVFCDFGVLIQPLAGARLSLSEQHLCLQWLDCAGSGPHWRFIVEAAMTGVASVTRWLSGERLPWQFLFRHDCPDYPEQYQVHLSGPLHFASQIDAMLLPLEYLERPWPNHSATARQAALQQCQQAIASLPGTLSLRHGLYLHLLEHIHQPPSLQESAEWLECSPATLKRRLKGFSSHYQQLLDEARLHQAVHWLAFHGLGPDQVCARLNFTDSTNFRRSFKRWSGQTPAMCHRQLLRFAQR